MARFHWPKFLKTGFYDLEDPATRDPLFVERAYRTLEPLLRLWFRPDVRGLERLAQAPYLYVGNHNAALLMPEIYLLGVSLYARFGIAGLPYGMGHRLGLRLPVLHSLLPPLGALSGDPALGLKLLRAGYSVVAYPGGELDSMRSYRKRNQVIFGRRRGYIRLALRAGVPIVPVVTSGAHDTLFIVNDGRWLAQLLRLDRLIGLEAWPLVVCLPWGVWLGVPPPHVPWRRALIQEYLEPLTFSRNGEAAARDDAYVEACHRRVHGAMEATLRRLALERKERAQ